MRPEKGRTPIPVARSETHENESIPGHSHKNETVEVKCHLFPSESLIERLYTHEEEVVEVVCFRNEIDAAPIPVTRAVEARKPPPQAQEINKKVSKGKK